jgi:hypothetical protein
MRLTDSLRPARRASFLVAASLVCASPALAQCEVQSLTALEASTTQKAGLGLSLGLSGDTAFVGWPMAESPYNGSGSVYVYERSASGWRRVARLHPKPGEVAGMFGTMTAVSGDRAVVTLLSKGLNKARAYFYDRGPNGWDLFQVVDPGPIPDDEWGFSLAMDGDVTMVGFAKDAGWSGSVYVYERGPTNWVFQGKLTASDSAADQMFGAGIAIDGDRAAIGSLSASWNPSWNGAVYIFERDAAGAWVETAKLVANEDTTKSYFGLRVDLAGDCIVASSYLQDKARGAVYVFEARGNGWVQTEKLSASDGHPFAHFASDLSLSGDRLLVGAFDDHEAGSKAGAAYLFQQGPSGWVQTAKLVSESTEPNDWLGYAVALEGETAMITAPIVAWMPKLGFGSVHVYSLPENATPYCFGSGCPCGNSDSTAGCANSTGSGGLLAACGTTSVATDDLVLTASSLRPRSAGLLAMGAGSASAPAGDGRLCIASGSLGTFRYAPTASNDAGMIVEGPGLVSASHTLFGPLGWIAAGQTWHLQMVYRDGAGSCGNGLNATNAIAVTFVP